jgi:hypothetical protein
VTLRFQVTTRRTGIRRIVKVVIIEDRDAFKLEVDRVLKAAGGDRESDLPEPAGWQVEACCISRATWEDRDPRAHQATIIFWAPEIDASKIAHEAAHAALHLYSIDSYRDYARASAHLHIGNEQIPYIISDLTAAIFSRVLGAGIDLPPGRIERGTPI